MPIYLPKSERAKLPEATCMRSPLRQAVWDKTLGRCFYCDRELIPDNGGTVGADGYVTQPKNTSMDIDHGTPKRRGGKDRLDNFYPSCTRCNSLKGARTVEEYCHGR